MCQIVYTNRRISKTLISDIVVLLSERHTLGKSKNRKMLLSILYSIQHLALQALLLRRGDWNTETKSEENSNFHQLLKLWAQENPNLIEWLRKDPEKYTSPEIQNELLEEMDLGMMRQIMSANIQNAMFITIMADETADISNKEQLVICIRWVDDRFVIHEDFIGMYPLERTKADPVGNAMMEQRRRQARKLE